jgi:hypothetical protein
MAPALLTAKQLSKRLGGNRKLVNTWKAPCPAHDDANASLSISVRAGEVLLRCDAGCTRHAIIDQLRERDLWPNEPVSHGSSVLPAPTAPAELIEPIGPQLKVGDMVHPVSRDGSRVLPQPLVIDSFVERHSQRWAVFKEAGATQFWQADQLEPADPVAPAEQPAPRRWRARVPNSHLGKIAGRDKAAAYAVQLLFWREYRRKANRDFVLNLAEAMKPPHEGGLDMSKHAFTAGIKILTESGVLERWQPDHRAPAHEKLAPAVKGEGYVELDPEFILFRPAKVVAFVAMVLLSPKPVRAVHVARGYLDIKDHATVNAIIEKAIDGGRIAGEKIGGRWVVCRPEMSSKLVKNGDANFRKIVTPTSEKVDHQLPRNRDTLEELTEGSSGTANGRAHPAAAASKESLDSNLAPRAPAACADPSDSFDAAAEQTLAIEDDVAALRRADMAGALPLYLLLTPGGLQGYRMLLAEYEHGEPREFARAAILTALARFAVDGCEAGFITSWGYFRHVIADERKLAHLVEHSIRPGDVLCAHRTLPIRGPGDNADDLHEEEV